MYTGHENTVQSLASNHPRDHKRWSLATDRSSTFILTGDWCVCNCTVFHHERRESVVLVLMSKFIKNALKSLHVWEIFNEDGTKFSPWLNSKIGYRGYPISREACNHFRIRILQNLSGA